MRAEEFHTYMPYYAETYGYFVLLILWQYGAYYIVCCPLIDMQSEGALRSCESQQHLR